MSTRLRTAVERIWRPVGAVLHFIGTVMTIVLLSVVYVVVFCPLGLLLRALGRAPLHAGSAPGSTWRARDAKAPDAEAVKRPY